VKRFQLFLIGFAAPLLLGAGDPAREAPMGSRISKPAIGEIPRGSYSDEERGRITLGGFARCALGNNPKRLAAVLARPADDTESSLVNSVSSDCLADGTLRFNTLLYRGALFVELLNVRERREESGSDLPFAPLELDQPLPPEAGEMARANYYLMAMAECLYRSDPVSVRTIARGQIGSDAEKAAFKALIPQLGACVPAGQTLSLSRTIIAYTLSEFMFRSQALPGGSK
jgi:hypothetical protein